MTYKEAYNDIIDWLRREAERIQYALEDIEAELKVEGVPSRGMAKELIRLSARGDQLDEIIAEMNHQMEEEIEDNEQNAAIRFCHEHKLLMIPVEAYHKLNVAYYAFQNGMTYEEAEKAIVGEGV